MKYVVLLAFLAALNLAVGIVGIYAEFRPFVQAWSFASFGFCLATAINIGLFAP